MRRLPSREIINDQRIVRFKDRITDTLAVDELGFYYQLVEQYRQEHNVPALEIAAALAKLLQGEEPLLLPKESRSRPAPDREERFRPRKKSGKPEKRTKQEEISETAEEGMARFRLEVGHVHGVKPGNIVGAIANEVNLDHEYIGRIDIYEDFSTVDLPEGMPRDVFRALKKVWVAGQQLNISRVSESPKPSRSKNKNKPAAKNHKKVAKRKSGWDRGSWRIMGCVCADEHLGRPINSDSFWSLLRDQRDYHWTCSRRAGFAADDPIRRVFGGRHVSDAIPGDGIV